MIDLRLLRAFVAVAETENVGQAAERLHISQSPLSRQIMQLEAQLGLALFERVRQRMRLTQEGRLLLAEARSLLSQAAQVEMRAGQIARGELGNLAIGYVEAAMHSGIIPGALKRLKNERPEAGVTVHPMRSRAQVEALRCREIDFGLLHSPPDDPGFEVMEIHEEPILLAVARDHPLADRTEIHADDLHGLAWIALSEASNPQARQRFLGNCLSSGFVPDIHMEVDDLLTALRLVGAGLGATFVQSTLRDALPGHLVFYPVPWFPSSIRIHAVWRRDDPKPLVAALRRALSA